MHGTKSLCPACGADKSTERISFENYVVYECGDCGLSFGIPTQPVTEAAFDNYPWTQEWTRNFPGHVEKARRALAKKREIIAGLTGNYVRSMLDIGCGNGAFLAAAGDLGIKADGIDIDASHIRFAKAQGLRASHCDIANYHSPQPYDLIHIKESFHLVTQSKQFIERVAELASNKTVVYLDSTHADGLASRYRKWVVKPPRYGQLYPPLHNRTFNRRSLTHILESAGFEVLKLVTFSKGNPSYCPTPRFSIRRYTANPLLDLFFLGGFIGCYAIKRARSSPD